KRQMKYGEKVGVIEVKGAILEAGPVLKDLRDFASAGAIKAIVMRIDSPGGAVGPSQEIFREIRRIRENKPVIASLGAVAASGGYYIASAADGIVANAGTITGSIGVLMEYTNFEALFEKIGLYPVIITSGKYKDIGSPLREMTGDEKKLLQDFVDTVHGQFVDDVAAGRKMNRQDVAEVADGRIITGQGARQYGLVDRIGNFYDAVEWAAEKGGIQGEPEVIYPPEEKLSIINYVLERISSAIRQQLTEISTGTLSGGYIYAPGQSP
ncbi:MAG: signal peptide peptidase SppA, partial [Desulfobacterales bacterium]|nr:signal peptide peptidase SppA [Desulfobacterales bacterium]